MQTCLHADEDFCIAEAQQYMWPSGQIAQKPSAEQMYLLYRGATVYVAVRPDIVKLAHILMDFRGTMQREVLSSEFIVQAFNLPIRSCITL